MANKKNRARLVLGILGGMGPEATVRFFDLVVRSTGAGRDQDHIPIIVWNDPRVPDRTAAVLGKGESPVPLLRAGAAALVKAGADIIVIPCVTAHYFFPGIAAGRRSKFLNLLDETRTHIRKNLPRVRKIGVLATTGTIRSGIIENTFGRVGVEVIVPDEKDQLKVMDAIYGRRGIKAGGPRDFSRKILAGVARRLVRRGARAILAGCTEIPLVLGGEDLSVPLIDPMAVGAKACVKRAGFAPRANVRRKG
jgi:aspartate racemase